MMIVSDGEVNIYLDNYYVHYNYSYYRNIVVVLFKELFVHFIENCQYDYMEEQAKDWLDNVYAPNNYKYNINSTQAAWEYYTNINDETSAAQVRLLN